MSWSVQPPLVDEFHFYGFIRDYHQLTERHCPRLDLPSNKPVTAILDGQQRLSSLNIGFRGSHAARRRYGRASNPDAYAIRFLYLNLLADAPENDLGMVHDFRFFSTPPPQNAHVGDGDQERPEFWYPVVRIFGQENPIVATRYLLESGLGADEASAADRLGRLFVVVHNEKVISFFREDEQDIDRVLDIFIRVNSAGKPLSYSDLLLSILTAHFAERDARASVHSLVDEMNRTDPGFQFDKDLVLKSGLALVGASDFSFKVRNFSRDNTALLDKHWDDIASSLQLAVNLLADFGFGAVTLTANSVVVPIALYLHHRGLGESYRTSGAYDVDRKVLRQWVNRVLIKRGIWGSGLDTLLRELRRTIVSSEVDRFPIEEISAAMRRRGKSTDFTPEEVVDLLSTSYTQAGCFALLATMFPNVDTRNVFHIDHVFPQKLFTRKELLAAGVPSDTLDTVRDRRHRLPNLQLLEGPVNVEKQAALPRGWALQKYPGDGYSDYLARHDLPDLAADLSGFESFYFARKRAPRERGLSRPA